MRGGVVHLCYMCTLRVLLSGAEQALANRGQETF